MKYLDELGKWLAGWMWESDGWLDTTTKMGVILVGIYTAVMLIWLVVGWMI